jgi:glyoxylase-like metal-dependent hydrolase (beta-lactamase superfamily II)
LSEILREFPDANPVALAESIPAMNEQISPGYTRVWSGFFPGQLPSQTVVPAALDGNTISVAGSAATLIPVGTTDTHHSSVVHVAEMNLVVSGDVVYNQTHMWLRGSTPDSRASWMRALDAVAALEATTIVAGHRNPQAADDDARRQIDECRRYIDDVEVALERSSSPAELIDRVMTAHPDLANPYTLWVSAYDLLGDRS